MGSFAATCCVSGFPIDAGTPVRWFLLTANPYAKGGFVCDMHGLWVPRTWPIRAKYNDYGSIEDWAADDPLVQNVLDGLKMDLVEVGVGDNSYHDVAVSRDSTFPQVLDAVWEGRVRIQRDFRGPDDNLDRPKVKDAPLKVGALPTLRLVQQALVDVAPPEARYLVDDVADSIRVRWDGLTYAYGKDAEWLGKAKAALDPYFNTVLTAGSGSYAHDVDLRVFRQPGKEKDGHPRHGYAGDKEEAPLLVQQAMIREDVWQALIRGQSLDWSGTVLTVKSYAKDVRSYIKDVRDAEKSGIDFRRARLTLHYDMRNGARLIAKDAVPFSVGLSTHFALLMQAGKVTPEVVQTVAEFTRLHDVLGNVRFVWRPGTTAGSQCGEWKPQVTHLTKLLKIAKAQAKEEEEEEG